VVVVGAAAVVVVDDAGGMVWIGVDAVVVVSAIVVVDDDVALGEPQAVAATPRTATTAAARSERECTGVTVPLWQIPLRYFGQAD
jgi:hypothetical protein